MTARELPLIFAETAIETEIPRTLNQCGASLSAAKGVADDVPMPFAPRGVHSQPIDPMTLRHVILTESDVRRLAQVLASEFAAAIGPREYLSDLRAEVERAEIRCPEKMPENVVTMNSTAVLRDLDSGEPETFTLVYPEKAKIADHRLSVLTPAGTALLGCRVGDTVAWRVLDGVRRLRIEQVNAESSCAPCPIQLHSP